MSAHIVLTSHPDKIVSLAPWRHLVASEFTDQIASGQVICNRKEGRAETSLERTECVAGHFSTCTPAVGGLALAKGRGGVA